MKETWEDIRDFVGLYRVSNKGRVKSLTKKRKNESWLKEQILLPLTDNMGYTCVILYYNNKAETHRVNELVAEAFILNPENKPQINHKNYAKTDNSVENLEWEL
jgi:hypothetical protein